MYICSEFVEVVYDFSWVGLVRVRYKGQSLIEDLLFSCCESFVAQDYYCVCGVRLLSSLVSGFSHSHLSTYVSALLSSFQLYTVTRGFVAGIHIRSDGTCRM